ncbi:hypothetical protein HMPREF6123_1441 [Oribacterium sinus F0268]|uniref:Uncharacterized protein n=1 Tax=Oribacterium sinus F0268 TaxID=585501 RepID=C2KY72_9FIRM|nr:hypothetical protein HMPREF6123_1441 [Oribacterium sinus F0268]
MYGLVKTLVIKLGFESFVNSEESKTLTKIILTLSRFESFVNSEESKTYKKIAFLTKGLRALLIQKRVKHSIRGWA